MAQTWDSSRWKSCKYIASGSFVEGNEVSIHYIRCEPPEGTKTRGTLLLIHGFPQTHYQFRHVITPFANAGYRVIAPDYRGAGDSSHPHDGFDFVNMAADFRAIIRDHLKVEEKIHLVGHDTGCGIAHAYASRYPDATASLVWGEGPVPGTKIYDQIIPAGLGGGLWHIAFHWQSDLPERLVQGKERIYLQHFFDMGSNNAKFLTDQDLDVYVGKYSKPGALRCAFGVYRALHKDREDNLQWFKEKGKAKVPSMTLNGAHSPITPIAEAANEEMYEVTASETVSDSGHWCAEENPEGFIEKVLFWVEKHPQ
ncbi:uncharacterized protein Z518_02407 [Rhinocladiella mackenziei CBS 650.93]|uniref:AB hydrolase-1 domain-containing protein n=1 Tax=Rhinocladiella mackenziei CBS 650.93 TaxID=1442369 RepID=A0A0D2HBD3_9EURO|nr:uncharacterized protein Z518_02407 [Rhinocladiella mackenziei CBS 650.93]KIX07753.1 hypothetical protein Z518_02407 [Rhinocladiella mackenziei CBS 650.93]